ncbi:hypothetical protein [Glaciecola punicea]|uniref:hypothetical protein n=1 Tax=Glaciecola punicea TaxID=56804 RepID=UPI0005906CE3|nr:hypothetical protein [Glaciecola punicea]
MAGLAAGLAAAAAVTILFRLCLEALQGALLGSVGNYSALPSRQLCYSYSCCTSRATCSAFSASGVALYSANNIARNKIDSLSDQNTLAEVYELLYKKRHGGVAIISSDEKTLEVEQMSAMKTMRKVHYAVLLLGKCCIPIYCDNNINTHFLGRVFEYCRSHNISAQCKRQRGKALCFCGTKHYTYFS